MRLGSPEDDNLLAKQDILGDQCCARADDIGEHTEHGLRDFTQTGRESIRHRPTRVDVPSRSGARVSGITSGA